MSNRIRRPPGAPPDESAGSVDNAARARHALLTAKALQDAILSSATFSSIATDANGVIQIFNVGAERMLGYAAAEVVDKITPADISDPQEIIARANALVAEFGTPIAPGLEALVFKAAHGIADIYELTYIRKDGGRLPAIVSVTALRDAQDGIIGYLLIGTDNTARKQAEQAISLLGAIVDSSEDAIISKNLNGIITSWNKSAERIFGYTKEEALGKSILMLIPQNRMSEEPEILARIGRGERIDHLETVRLSKDHSVLDIALTISAIKDAKGRIIGVSKIARDITALKHAEEAMQRKLVSAVSHELLTPIAAVKASVETLRSGVVSSVKDRSRFLGIIERQTRNLTRMITRLLIVAGIEAGKARPVIASIPLAEFVEELLPDAASLAKERAVSISTQIESGLALRADRSHLAEIFQNLIENAVRYNKKNGSIEIKARRGSMGEAEVSVRDTGIGIPAADLPLVFQQFHRAQNARALRIEGSGLGLYIVKTLVDSNSGKISAESVAGEGSIFRFTLPAERA
jgi:PAS domain S-box-containing protein